MAKSSEQKSNLLDKYHRVESPENTLVRLKQGLHNLGVELELKFGETTLLSSANLVIPSLRLTSNGKGITKLITEVSAYAEMVERISAGLEPGVAIDPFFQISHNQMELLQKFITYKYIDGSIWSHQDTKDKDSVMQVESLLRNESFGIVDIEFFKMKSELLRHWIPAESLVSKKKIFVPPMFIRWISSTNGLAAGNTIGEATLHACYEIFERFALISFLRAEPHQADTIDNSSIENETIQKFIEFFEDKNFDIIIKDLSFDGIFPVYAVIFINKNIPSENIMYNTIKAGASFSNEEAIIRCFTERLQGTDLDSEQKNTVKREHFEKDNKGDYLPLFFRGFCPVDLTDQCTGKVIKFIQKNETNLDTCINRCITIVTSMKTDLVVVDYTHPVLEFPTVRVIIPGLSDFIKWWNPEKITRDFIGKYKKEDEDYHNTLFKVMSSFFSTKSPKVYK